MTIAQAVDLVQSLTLLALALACVFNTLAIRRMQGRKR